MNCSGDFSVISLIFLFCHPSEGWDPSFNQRVAGGMDASLRWHDK